jgi:hypothetical protein
VRFKNRAGALDFLPVHIIAFKAFQLDLNRVAQPVLPFDAEIWGVEFRARQVPIRVPSRASGGFSPQHALVNQVDTEGLRLKAANAWVNLKQMRNETLSFLLDIDIAACLLAVCSQLGFAISGGRVTDAGVGIAHPTATTVGGGSSAHDASLPEAGHSGALCSRARSRTRALADEWPRGNLQCGFLLKIRRSMESTAQLT